MVIDDTAIPKKGKHSVGVAAQYASALGKTANCQTLVSLTLARGEVPVTVALRLFLPEGWTSDRARLKRVGVPAEHWAERTKPEIALAEIDRMIAARVHFGCVLADAGYGLSAPFRQGLTARGLAWAVGIPRHLKVYPVGVQLIWPIAKRGRPRQHSIPDILSIPAEDMLADAKWQNITWRTGTKGKLKACRRGSGEVTAIEWRHIDWQRRFVRLPDSKTNEPRTIHLSDAAVEVLKTLPRVGKFVIAGAKPDEAYKNLSRAWIKTRDRTPGLEDVRLHDLRHSYASLAAGQGVSLQMIGKLLGHKVPATTQRYAHLARDAVAAVNDQLGAAMVAAIDRRPPESASVIKMRRRARGRQ